jgi:hypothetical protein
MGLDAQNSSKMHRFGALNSLGVKGINVVKKLLISLAASVALFVVPIVAFQQLYDFSAWEEKLASELTSLSGYPISTAGEMGLRFKPRPVFVIPKLKVDNVAWAKEADFITVGRIEMQPSLQAILTGKVLINSFEVFGLVVNLETDGDGGDNWHPRTQTNADSSTFEPSAAVAPLNLSIRDIKIRFRSGWAQREKIYNIDTVTVKTSHTDAPIEVFASTSVDELPIGLQGSLGTPSNYLVNQPAKIVLTGNYGSAQLSLSGAIEQPKTFTGAALDFIFDAKSLNEFGSLNMGPLGDYDLPQDKPLRITAKLNSGSQGLAIKDVVARIGNVIIR